MILTDANREFPAMILRTCAAPGPYLSLATCGREFVPNSDHQLYCSPKCANRAHRAAAKENKARRLAGLPTPRPGFPQDMAKRLALNALATHESVPAQPSLGLRASGPAQTSIAPIDMINEVRRLEELDRLTAEAQSASILEKMGYLRPGATQGVEPTRGAEPNTHPRAEPDRSAEPQQHGPMSTEDEAPDFRDKIDEADAPLDYPETDDL